MMTRMGLFLLILLVFPLAACGPALAAIDADDQTIISTALPAADQCPVTQPPEPPFIPPEPYPPEAPYGDFWFGTNDLWVLLSPDGRWHSLPKDEHGYGQKLLWFREGYDMTVEQRPDITIRGRQIDGDETFEQTGATNGHHPDVGMFMLTGVTVPNAGCWEITGYYRKTSLSFVVWVEP